MMVGMNLGLMINSCTGWQRTEIRMDLSALRGLYLMNGWPADSDG